MDYINIFRTIFQPMRYCDLKSGVHFPSGCLFYADIRFRQKIFTSLNGGKLPNSKIVLYHITWEFEYKSPSTYVQPIKLLKRDYSRINCDILYIVFLSQLTSLFIQIPRRNPCSYWFTTIKLRQLPTRRSWFRIVSRSAQTCLPGSIHHISAKRPT